MDHKVLENMHSVFGNDRLSDSPGTQEAETEAWPQIQGPPGPYSKYNSGISISQV